MKTPIGAVQNRHKESNPDHLLITSDVNKAVPFLSAAPNNKKRTTIEFPAGAYLRANIDAVRKDLLVSDQFTVVIRLRAQNKFTNNIFRAVLLGPQGPKDRTGLKLIQTNGTMLLRAERWKKNVAPSVPWVAKEWGTLFLEWNAGKTTLIASQTGKEIRSETMDFKTPEKKTLLDYEVGFPQIHENKTLRRPVKINELLIFSGILSDAERVKVQDSFSW